MSRKPTYSFAEKRHSQKGITSTVLGALSAVICIVLVGIAMASGGKGGAYLGAIGMTAIIIAAAGLVTGLRSFKEKNRLSFFSKAGSMINGTILVIWLAIYLFGVR